MTRTSKQKKGEEATRKLVRDESEQRVTMVSTTGSVIDVGVRTALPSIDGKPQESISISKEPVKGAIQVVRQKELEALAAYLRMNGTFGGPLNQATNSGEIYYFGKERVVVMQDTFGKKELESVTIRSDVERFADEHLGGLLD